MSGGILANVTVSLLIQSKHITITLLVSFVDLAVFIWATIQLSGMVLSYILRLHLEYTYLYLQKNE